MFCLSRANFVANISLSMTFKIESSLLIFQIFALLSNNSINYIKNLLFVYIHRIFLFKIKKKKTKKLICFDILIAISSLHSKLLARLAVTLNDLSGQHRKNQSRYDFAQHVSPTAQHQLTLTVLSGQHTKSADRSAGLESP